MRLNYIDYSLIIINLSMFIALVTKSNFFLILGMLLLPILGCLLSYYFFQKNKQQRNKRNKGETC